MEVTGLKLVYKTCHKAALNTEKRDTRSISN